MPFLKDADIAVSDGNVLVANNESAMHIINFSFQKLLSIDQVAACYYTVNTSQLIINYTVNKNNIKQLSLIYYTE